jgi:metal-responsive CopG/Arc/MetJ family transcriptional regulator
MQPIRTVITIPPDLLQAIDAATETLTAEGERPSRSATIRVLLRRGLEALQRKPAKPR